VVLGLFFCNEILTAAGSHPNGQLIRDRLGAFTPGPLEAARSPYVDNGNVIGITRASVGRTFDRMVSDLVGKGLALHERVDVTETPKLVGIELDGAARTLRHTMHRTWRLHLGLQEALRLHTCNGRMLQRLVGHIVHAFELLRPGLSILRSVYAFIERHLHDRVELWPSVRDELEACSWLVFVAEVRLGAPWSPVALCSDASELGYALKVRKVTGQQCREAARFRERWRFVTVEHDAGQQQQQAWDRGAAVLAPNFGRWSDGQAAAGGASDPRRRQREWRDMRQVELTPCEAGIPALSNDLMDPAAWDCGRRRLGA